MTSSLQNPDLSTVKSKAMLLFAGFFLTLGAFLFGCVLTQVRTWSSKYKLATLYICRQLCSI